MKSTKLLLFICILGLVAGVLTGCGGSPDEESTSDIEESTATESADVTDADDTTEIKNVAFLAPMTNTEYWMTIVENTERVCENAGITCTVYSAESNAATQLEQIENCITSGVDAIIIDPLDNDSSDDALTRARKEGIFVVMTGSVTENMDAYDVGIAASEAQVGDAVAQAAAEWIEETFPTADAESVGVALYSFPFRPLDVERCEAFYNITNYTDKARIDVEYELSIDNYSTEVMEYGAVMLQNYPDVKCIMSYSDTFANAIDEILKGTSGIVLSEIANITVDQSTATYANITAAKDGKSTVIATVVPGLNLDEQILAALQGTIEFDDEDTRIVYKEITTVDTDNIEEYFTVE